MITLRNSDDIGAAAERLRADRERLRSEIARAQDALDERSSEILAAPLKRNSTRQSGH